MTRVVIVGEMFYSDLSVGGGPVLPDAPPPGIWPSPGRPSHPIAPGGRPPGIWGGPPLYPDQGLPGAPPGFWGGVAPPYPDQGLPGRPPTGIWPSPGHPSHPVAPGGPPPGIWPGVPTHPWVPPAGVEIPPPPEDIIHQYVVAVWNPTQQSWSVSVSETAPAPQN